MRIGRVIGTCTISRRLSDLRHGTWLIVDALDAQALTGHKEGARRATPMPESLIVFDELGAAVGNLIAVSEGREAAQAFYPGRVPIDAYNAAILDSIEA
jgi:ethanolamine utilization protein EutN